MDHSIALVTPELMRARGAEDFDRGLGIDDHDMNPGSSTIHDWKIGWRQRQAEHSRKSGNQQRRRIVKASPP